MNEQVLFEKKETYIHETANREETNNNGLSEIVKIGGRLQVVKNKFGIFIRFMPYGVDSNNVSDDWAFVVNNSVLTYNKDSGNNENESVTVENKTNLNKYKLQFELNELSAVRRIYQGYDIPSLVFMLSDGRVWPKIFFYKGGSKEFLQELKAYFIFTKNPNDPRLWSVQMQNGEKFQQSLNELKLFNEQRDTVMKKFLNEPLQSTFLGLSRVTNMVRDVLRPGENMAAGGQAPQAKFSPSSFEQAMKKYGSKGKEDVDGENKPSSSTATNNRHHDDLMADLMDSLTLDNIHSTINDGYEMVTKVDLGPMPEVCRGLPVDRTAVKYDKDGRLIDVDVLKAMIFRGGIEHELRKEVWKFMLNYYTWDSTEKWRIDRRKQRVDDYFRMKLQWKTMSDEQKSKFSTMKERENLIEKDVQRTDRTNSYFEGEHNPNLNAMKDILMTYNMYNFDLGYVQGMSDLLAPIMVIMDNEVDSFWCFAGFMDRVESNFLMDQLNIKLQLSNLKALLEFVDSKFSDYMERNDSANMYFCFRWILILFKREFNFPDVMTLWEVLWTDLPCKNFHLLICISILLMKKDDIIGNNYGFNEILKYINDLSFRIDLDKALENAEGLYLQIKNFKNLPSNICEILGFPVVEKNKEAEEFDETLGAIAAKATPRDQSPAASSIRMTPSKSSSSSLTASAATNSSSAIPKNKSYTFRKDEDSIELLNQ